MRPVLTCLGRHLVVLADIDPQLLSNLSKRFKQGATLVTESSLVNCLASKSVFKITEDVKVHSKVIVDGTLSKYLCRRPSADRADHLIDTSMMPTTIDTSKIPNDDPRVLLFAAKTKDFQATIGDGGDFIRLIADTEIAVGPKHGEWVYPLAEGSLKFPISTPFAPPLPTMLPMPPINKDSFCKVRAAPKLPIYKFHIGSEGDFHDESGVYQAPTNGDTHEWSNLSKTEKRNVLTILCELLIAEFDSFDDLVKAAKLRQAARNPKLEFRPEVFKALFRHLGSDGDVNDLNASADGSMKANDAKASQVQDLHGL